MTVADLPSEVDVLAKTLEWFRDQNHFTDDFYIYVDDTKNTNGQILDQVGPHTASTCAIGGVEHAIWLLTKENVFAVREAAFMEEPTTRRRQPVLVLYVAVMRRLNRVARQLYGDHGYETDPLRTIEQVTLIHEFDKVERYEAMRNVLRRALRDARKEAAA